MNENKTNINWVMGEDEKLYTIIEMEVLECLFFLVGMVIT